MKVLICSGIYPPEAGGPATYSKILAEELVKRGHEVGVITYSSHFVMATPSLPRGKPSQKIASFPPVADPRNDNYNVIRIIRSWFKPWHYYKYYRAVKKSGRDADILYAQDAVSAGYPTYLAARALKKPYVVKVTGDYSWEQAVNRALTGKLIDEFQGLEIYPRKVRMIRDIQIRVCRAAEAVITPSEYLKRIVAGWGVKEKRVHVIYNAVEPVPEIPRVEARRELGIPDEDFLILSIGRNVPWKGFELLREVIEELNGFPPLEGEGKGGVNRLTLRILHDADRDTINKYLRAADLFVLNTGYEGMSHIILEAMSAGLPVITTNVGGNPEVVESIPLFPSPLAGEGRVRGNLSEANGILVDYNNKAQIKDAILKLYSDAGLRKKLIENAKQTLSKYSLDNMITQTLDALTEIK